MVAPIYGDLNVLWLSLSVGRALWVSTGSTEECGSSPGGAVIKTPELGPSATGPLPFLPFCHTVRQPLEPLLKTQQIMPPASGLSISKTII